MTSLEDHMSDFTHNIWGEVTRARIYHECEGEIQKSVPKDHHLALQGLLSDDKTVIQRNGFFYPTLTQIIDSFSGSS